jgi:membrane protein DedA with SNARE-associated domain
VPVSILAGFVADASSVPTDGLTGFVADIMGKLGLFGAGLVLAVETFFPFLPSEVALPLAGFTASIPGNFGLIPVIIATTIGSLVGALALYAFSSAFGRDRTRTVLLWAPLVTAHDIDKGEAWFARNDARAVFFGRFVPGIRALISVPAGVEGMGLLRFSAYTAAGSLIWNTIWISAGYQLGENWTKVEKYSHLLTYTIVVLIVIAIAWFVWTHLKTRRTT